MESKVIHRNQTEATAQALQLIFENKKYADHVIESVLKSNPKWGTRDRRFIAENTYDIVRWWRWITTCGEIDEADAKKFQKAIRTMLVLNETELPHWLQDGIAPEKIKENVTRFENERAIRESIPDWLDQIGVEELGDQWEREIHALNEQAKVVLRANTLKVSCIQLQNALKHADVETTTLNDMPDALVLEKRVNIFQQPVFKQGWLEVQDASSQLVAPFTDVQSGMRVIDACAGAGGKTLHLAALMKNKGQLLALDTEEWKLKELKHRLRRAGAGVIETRLIDSTKVIKRLHDSADRVLLDVPCSGLGVLRRNPDAKWKLNPEYIEQVKKLQADIFDRYSRMVKAGGKLVYATCSILSSENKNQVTAFLSSHKEFSLEEEKQVFPSEGFDGFYMARLVRNAV